MEFKDVSSSRGRSFNGAYGCLKYVCFGLIIRMQVDQLVEKWSMPMDLSQWHKNGVVTCRVELSFQWRLHCAESCGVSTESWSILQDMEFRSVNRSVSMASASCSTSRRRRWSRVMRIRQ